MKERQILNFSSQELNDEKTLQDYGITSNSQIDLIVNQKNVGMEIKIKTMAGKELLFDVESSLTVLQLQEKVQELTGIRIEFQRPVFEGKELRWKQDKTLSEVKIEDGACLALPIIYGV